MQLNNLYGYLAYILFKELIYLIIIAAVDDEYGLMFNNRRQSQDKFLREYILKITKESKLFMNEYSFKQFSQQSQNNILVNDDFLMQVKKDDYCFVENYDITPYVDSIQQIILFKWNRKYPSDFRFPTKLLDGFEKKSEIEIKGNSHPIITQETYIRR